MVANRDGGVENLEVKGDLLLRIAEPDRGLIRVRLGNVNNKQFQFKVRPALASRTHQTRGSIQARPGVACARAADPPERRPESVHVRQRHRAQGRVAAIPDRAAARRREVAVPEQGGRRRAPLRCVTPLGTNPCRGLPCTDQPGVPLLGPTHIVGSFGSLGHCADCRFVSRMSHCVSASELLAAAGCWRRLRSGHLLPADTREPRPAGRRDLAAVAKVRIAHPACTHPAHFGA